MDFVVEPIGKVRFKKHHRAKNIIIHVYPFDPVCIVLPRYVSYKKAKEYLASQISWVIKKQESLRSNYDASKVNKVDYEASKKVLIERAYKLAVKHGFEYRRISIRNQRTLWGSCSGNNSISLNSKASALSDELMDYVILHEFVHTKIKNHSALFWKELEKYIPNPKKLDSQLKKISL